MGDSSFPQAQQLPPLAEQHRTVSMEDERMARCDQLQQQLSQADQRCRRLLEALLPEALREPAGALAFFWST